MEIIMSKRLDQAEKALIKDVNSRLISAYYSGVQEGERRGRIKALEEAAQAAEQYALGDA